MPSTVNGIGTHYYGKSNRQHRVGVCQACGANTTLESYDTRLWVVILFIPVIPLGRKRVIDQCAHCNRHWVADATSYEMSKQLAVSGALDKYREQPSPETALELHGRLLSFHQHQEAEEFRKLAMENHGDSGVLHAGLGIHLEQMGRQDEASPFFEKALDLRPDLPEARMGVAHRRMAEGKLDEARELLKFLELPGAGQLYSLGPLETLAQQYQRQGRHAEVVALCRQIIAELPWVGQVHNFRKFVSVSEKALGGGESILPKRRFSLRALFDAKSGQYSPQMRWLTVGAAITAVVVVALAVTNAYLLRHRTVYAIYDRGAPVQLTIDDGAPVTLNALTKLELAEGRHRVKVTGAVNDDFEIEMGMGYFERFFNSPVWVINADGGTALVLERIHYAKNPRPSDVRVLIGDRLFYVKHVDYTFLSPPPTIKMDSKTNEVTKIYLHGASEPANRVFSYAVENCGQAAAFDFGEAQLRRYPEDAMLLSAYVHTAEETGQADRARQFLNRGLAQRPVAVRWHRAYQDLGRAAARNAELAAEYDALLQKEPADARLLYLRGRVEDDHRKGTALMQRACAADPALGWPWMALAYEAASRGDWKQSKDQALKAVELKLDDPSLNRIRHEACLATGDVVPIEADYRRNLQNKPPLEAMQDMINLCELLASLGRADDARQAVTEWTARCPAETRSLEMVTIWSGMVSYMIGDFADLQEKPGRVESPMAADLRFHALVATGRPKDAAANESLKKSCEEPLSALALSTAFDLTGEPAEAAVWREKACAGLDGRDIESKRVAALLREEKAPSHEQLDAIMTTPNVKALVAASLAVRFPEKKEAFASLARLLNVSRLPPYHLVQKAIGPKP